MNNAELAAKYAEQGWIDINQYDEGEEFQAILAALRSERSSTPPQRPNSPQLEWAIATVEADREGDGIGQAANFLLLELIALRSETAASATLESEK